MISARFVADFTQFQDAVTRAEVKLVDFSKGANKVETALNRMTESFSGRRVVQEAVLMERAIANVGGLSKLTGTELEQVGNKATEAIAKMKKMGIDVPPGLQKIADTAKPIPSMFSKMTSALGPLGPLVASTFTIGAVVGFGKAILADADALVKLHDKTGISLGGLQDLGAAARQSGNTIEQVTSAISQMQNRLSSGDKSAVAALKELKLSFEDLKTLSPDHQFRAIAAAIAEIEDPAARTRLAMDAFGRAGAEVLPTLLANIEKIAAGTVKMSDEGVKALERFGDGFDTLWANTQVTIAKMVVGLADFAVEVGKASFLPSATGRVAGPETKRPPLSIGEAAAAIGMPTPEQLTALGLGLDQLTKRVTDKHAATQKARVEADRITATNLRWNDSIKHLTSSSVGAAGSFGAIGRLMPDLVGNTGDWQGQMALLGSRDLPLVTAKLKDMGQGTVVLEQIAQKASAMGVVLESIPDTLIAAFTGGGGVIGALQAIAVQFGNSFADTLRLTIKTNLDAKGTGLTAGGMKAAGGIGAVAGLGAGASGATLNQGLGTVGMAGASVAVGALTSGATLSAAVALGAATFGIGAAAVVAYVAVKKLLNDPEKKVNPIRQSFVDAAGGLEALNKRAVEAGVTLTRMLDAKTPQAYEAAIRDLNKALEFQDSAMQMLDEAVKKYGFSMAQLGPTLSKQKLNEQAAQLITDFRLLEKAGIDVNHISTQMSSSINEYLQNALKTGNAVPEAMREILNQLATMGLLTDENGVLISDLEDAGVTFAQTLEGQFESLITTIQKLTDAIARGLGLAIENVPDMDLTVNRHYRDDEDAGGEGGEAGAAHGMAKGGYGRVLRPTLFLAGEAGAENFAFWKPGASRGGGNTVNVGDVVVQGQFGSEAEFGREVAKASIQRARRMGVRFSGR